MMTYSKDAVSRRLERLAPTAQLAFGLACVERMLPNYAAFSREQKWGDFSTLRSIADQIWNAVPTMDQLQSSTQQLMDQCESLVPDSEDFETALTSAAQEAVWALCSLIDFIAGDSRAIAEASSFAIDTVDLFVQDDAELSPDAPDLENLIASHPLMVREVSHQDNDLILLEQEKSPLLLKDRWYHQATSNINRQ